jgi:ParB family chromosome partitioning protein
VNKKAKQSEADFNATLAARLAAAAGSKDSAATSVNGGMHMNTLPEKSTKSFEAVFGPKVLEPVPAGVAPAIASGLPALHPTRLADNQVAVVETVPLHLCDDSPYQPRTTYDETELQQLARTMQDRGQDEPVILRMKADGRFEIISGHRRIRAARLNGSSTIQAVVKAMSDRDAKLATLVSNESQIRLSDYEKAISYQIALDDGYAATQTEVGTLFSCSQGRVGQCLSILRLPAPFLSILETYPKLINYRFAAEIRKLHDEFPDAEARIVDGVMLLLENNNMTPLELREFVLKGLDRKQRASPTEPMIIADKAGVSLYTIRVVGKRIVIDVKNDSDPDLAAKRAMAALREMSDSE